MMTPKECVQAWKKVCKCYDDTRENNNPVITMQNIITTLGKEKTKEVFATVAAIKKHDKRIYGKNREYMESIEINPESIEWKHGNPMIYAELDNIHTSHINQLITEIRKEERKV